MQAKKNVRCNKLINNCVAEKTSFFYKKSSTFAQEWHVFGLL